MLQAYEYQPQPGATTTMMLNEFPSSAPGQCLGFGHVHWIVQQTYVLYSNKLQWGVGAGEWLWG